MSSSLAGKWTTVDSLFQKIRYGAVSAYIPRNCILVDLGCGNGDFIRFLQGRLAQGHGSVTVEYFLLGTNTFVHELK